MRVLITGVAGQVGSHLADALLARGDSVWGIDNFATGRSIHLPDHPAFTFVEGSIADAKVVETLFADAQPDVVAHAAAAYKDPANWIEDNATNTVGMVNLIRAAQHHSVRRIVYFQTALVYGVVPKTNPVTLEHPFSYSNSSYAITKGAAEDFLCLSGLDYVTFRLANVIGDRCVSGPLPIFYQRLVDGRTCFVTPARRDFVYSGDLVAAVVRALDGTGSGAYHFSSGGDYAVEELYHAMANALELEPVPDPDRKPLGEEEAGSILLDPSRTVEDFGTVATTGLDEIVRRAVAYYREYGTEGEFTHLKVRD